ncbi:unnamed protein product [Cunninghamella blakesleeana]
MADVIPTLSWYNVFVASTFLFINILISSRLKLGIGRSIFIAAIQCIIQLTVMGMILGYILKAKSPYLVFSLTFVMIFLSACETVYSKSQWVFKGMFPTAFIGTLFSTILIGGIGVRYAIDSEPFWLPEYFIPTIGLLLGFTSGAMAVAIHTCLHYFRTHFTQIETYLAFGATRKEALVFITKESIRISLLPCINQMSITGSIIIPGVLAGQVMNGIAMQFAVFYQIIITFLITSSTTLGVIIVVWVCLQCIVDNHHRIRQDRIKKASQFNPKAIMSRIHQFISKQKKKIMYRSLGKEDEYRPLLS